MKQLNFILVFVFLVLAACNSCQTSTAPIETGKVESSNVISIQGRDYDCTNVIVVDETYPLEKCGQLNQDGKVYVRDINAYSTLAKDSTFIDKNGILQVKGDAVSFKSIQ